MYVIYPASRVVGLTINYREINQLRPFPEKYPTPEPEDKEEKSSKSSLETHLPPPPLIKLEPTPPKQLNTLRERATKSESPNIKITNEKNIEFFIDDSLIEFSKNFEETLSLKQNLKNLEVYCEKKAQVKRSLSLNIAVKKVSSTSLKMSNLDFVLKELTHPALNETLKAHNAVAFKLVKTVSEFTEQLARIYEQHAEEMQLLVSNFRKKNSELRKERQACPSSLFHTWETLLQDVEIDSQAHSEIASILGRQVSRPLIEKSFFRKMQSRKVFSHRESFESIIKQNEDKLGKIRTEYKNSYLAYMSGPTTNGLANYINAHNEYVAQLHITNGILSQYHSETLPLLLKELEDIYADLCATLSESLLQGAEMISSRAQEQCKRYEGLSSQCRAIHATTDLTHFVRSVTVPPNHPPDRRHFAAPQPPQPQEGPDGQPLPVDPNQAANLPPSLKNEIVIDRLSSMQVKERFDEARKESLDLETKIKQLNDALHTLIRVQLRSVESNLYNKANEIQEDISAKQFELHQSLMQLSALKAQKELFGSKVDSGETGRDRKMSSSSTGSMKSKWMKAFKNLKTTSNSSNGASNKDDKKNGKDNLSVIGEGGAHSYQEYTYKKITPCDVCSQVLRGHTRQGLKCRVCKLNTHVDCQDKAPKCQQKSRLLRRQKSTSEIEAKIMEPTLDEERMIQQEPQQRRQGPLMLRGNASLSVGPAPHVTSSAPHSPRRQKLNLRMKSLSLDSPESTEHVQKRRAQGHHSAGHSSHSSSSKLHSPSSPVHNRRLLSARNMRTSSVELADENDKSLSSASTSPCPSPKPHRLLPTNLYVVLYNFKSRHPDELDLKAGYKVTVMDSSDPDWWKGKCLGRIGFFPSKYVMRLEPGEKPLQVTHNLQVQDGENGLMLLRDQIVIQVGEEVDGMVMIRSGDNKTGACPLKFLQEV